MVSDHPVKRFIYGFVLYSDGRPLGSMTDQRVFSIWRLL